MTSILQIATVILLAIYARISANETFAWLREGNYSLAKIRALLGILVL